jgi:hypothetical protein
LIAALKIWNDSLIITNILHTANDLAFSDGVINPPLSLWERARVRASLSPITPTLTLPQRGRGQEKFLSRLAKRRRNTIMVSVIA